MFRALGSLTSFSEHSLDSMSYKVTTICYPANCFTYIHSSDVMGSVFFFFLSPMVWNLQIVDVVSNVYVNTHKITGYHNLDFYNSFVGVQISSLSTL